MKKKMWYHSQKILSMLFANLDRYTLFWFIYIVRAGVVIVVASKIRT